MINTLLVRWAGGWREVTDSAAVANHGRHEALLGLGAVGSTTEVDWAARQILTFWVEGQTQITADLRPSSAADTPYEAFDIGDTVTVPARTGGASVERVVALTVAEDDNGQLTWAPDLKAVHLSATERFEQALKKMADGTFAGQSKTATPVGSPEAKPAAVRPITTIAAPPGDGGSGGLAQLPVAQFFGGRNIANGAVVDIAPEDMFNAHYYDGAEGYVYTATDETWPAEGRLEWHVVGGTVVLITGYFAWSTSSGVDPAGAALVRLHCWEYWEDGVYLQHADSGLYGLTGITTLPSAPIDSVGHGLSFVGGLDLEGMAFYLDAAQSFVTPNTNLSWHLAFTILNPHPIPTG
jgi:hypothetical protein